MESRDNYRCLVTLRRSPVSPNFNAAGIPAFLDPRMNGIPRSNEMYYGVVTLARIAIRSFPWQRLSGVSLRDRGVTNMDNDWHYDGKAPGTCEREHVVASTHPERESTMRGVGTAEGHGLSPCER